VKPHWEPTTLKLSAKQARVLWGMLDREVCFVEMHDRAGCNRKLLTTMRAIRRKLGGE